MQKESGRSMVEMLGVLAIIGVLAAGAYALAGSAIGKYRISQGVAQLSSLSKGISRYYAAAGQYVDIDVENLIKDGVPMSNMKKDANSLRHVFGGDVVVGPQDCTTPTGEDEFCESFYITFEGLYRKACIEMATMSWADTDSSRLKSIKINDTEFVWKSSNASEKELPISIVDAGEDCESSGNSITWVFR